MFLGHIFALATDFKRLADRLKEKNITNFSLHFVLRGSNVHTGHCIFMCLKNIFDNKFP